MMNQMTALVFPDTLPDPELMFPLLQVFDEVVYLQAVEDEVPATSGPLVERLSHENRLHLVAPIPLGEQRSRFQALMGDLRQRGAEYISQLSMLTVAGMQRRDQGEKRRDIVSRLLNSAAIGPSDEEERVLWQARLVLKLAEIREIEQAELDAAMAQIVRRQEVLLAELREEGDEVFALTERLAEGSRQAEAALPHRLKAWSHLCFRGPVHEWHRFMVTGYEAALEALAESYERLSGQQPIRLAALTLPRVTRQGSVTGDWAQPITSATPAMVQALTALRDNGPQTRIEIEQVATQFNLARSDWEAEVARRWPIESGPRCRLELLYFPGISARRLFLEGFVREKGVDDDGNAQPLGVVTGLLTID